jgi:hypothetical protein
MIDVATWPEAPIEERPKPLYVDETLADIDIATLSARGWVVIDVRSMPNKSDADRLAGLKAKLEGIRLGSITAPTKNALDTLKLEASVVGPKMAVPEKVVMALMKDDLNQILDFQHRRAFDGAFSTYDDFLERVEKHVKESKKRKK